MISFSYPWALLLAAPAVWLLWRAPRRSSTAHTVSNLFLWLDAANSSTAQNSTRKAPPPWIVWVQAAVLAALAVALAGPTWTARKPSAVVIIDASPSMSARAGGTSRLDLARAEARALTASRPSAIQQEVSGSDVDLVAAVQSAHQKSPTEIIVISDLPEPAGAAAAGVAWRMVGAPASNVAITSFDGTDDGGAILEVQNFGDTPQSAALNVSGGSSIWSQRVTLPPFEARAFLLPSGPDRELTAELRVDNPAADALSEDNRRRASIRSARTIRVALIGAADLNVEAAVRAVTNVAVTAAPTAADAKDADVFVCHGECARTATTPLLVFTPGGSEPVIARAIAPDRRVTAAVDLNASPWTLTAEFPVFVAQSIEWLAGREPASLPAVGMAARREADTFRAPAPVFSAMGAPARASGRSAIWLLFAGLALAGVLIDAVLRQRRLQICLAAAALIAIGLTGATLPAGQLRREVAVALDASASVAGNQRAAAERIRSESDAQTTGDRISVMKFGGAETDIASALRGARASLPDGADNRILLVSDGRQTAGDAVSEARSIGAAGVPIDVIPIDSRVPAFIDRVDAPPTARTGAALPIRVRLKGSAGQVVRLSIARDGKDLDSKRIVLDGRGEATAVIEDTPRAAGLASYRALLSDERADITLSESGAAVFVSGRAQVLIISSRSSPFAARLRRGEFDVVERTPATSPDSAPEFAAFSAVVVDDVSPREFSLRQQQSLADAVANDGVGLLVLGSAASLSAADYSQGPLADALPVDFAAPPRAPSSGASLALVVDVSGSMASASDGVTKISAAKQAIQRALSVVAKSDAVEVIGFAGEPVLLIGPNDARDASTVEEKLRSLVPSGNTLIAPAVRQAASWLATTPNSRRRILLVTDGKTSAVDAEAARTAVRGQSIEVSVVTIGKDAEREWLTELAATTGGRTYFPDNLSLLPREVAREAARGAQGREVSERFAVRAGAHPLSPRTSAPVLGGYVAGKLRSGAVAAWKSHADDAVLAAWPRGLGRVAVFSGDLAGPWGAPLQAWPEQAGFWLRAVAWLSRSAEQSDVDAELSLAAGPPRIVVETAVSAGPLPSVKAVVGLPSGQSETVALYPVSPNRFEGPIELGETGDYRAVIVVTNSTGLETRTLRGWHWTGDAESQSRGLNLSVLEGIAAASGGRMLKPLNAVVSPSETVFGGQRARGSLNIAPWVLLLALSLLSFEYIRGATEAS